MAANVLIDTSAWIDFFRDSRSPTGDMVAELIRLDCAYLTGPIMAELLHGCPGKKEAALLQFVFSAVPCLEVIRENGLASASDRCADCRCCRQKQNGGSHLR